MATITDLLLAPDLTSFLKEAEVMKVTCKQLRILRNKMNVDDQFILTAVLKAAEWIETACKGL